MIFILSALAVWRICHLLAFEDGPWDVVIKARLKLADSMLGKAMNCVSCSSVWVAFVFSGLTRTEHFVAYWLALSAGAIFIEKLYELLRRHTEYATVPDHYTGPMEWTRTTESSGE